MPVNTQDSDKILFSAPKETHQFWFYIKITALESEEPFSGETIKELVVKDHEKIQRLIEASRKNYAITYVKKVVKKVVRTIQKPAENTDKKSDEKQEQTASINRLPKRKKNNE